MPARGVAFRLVIPMQDSTTGALKSGVAPAIDVSLDGAAYAPATNTPATEIGASGTYAIVLTAAEMTADVIEAKATAAGARATVANIATDSDTYQAKVTLTDDDGSGADRYVVVWFKNGQPITAGIVAPTIEVFRTADGLDLVPPSAMTPIGATGTFRYVEAVNRIISGVAYIALATATIDGALRSWFQPVSRDS